MYIFLEGRVHGLLSEPVGHVSTAWGYCGDVDAVVTKVQCLRRAEPLRFSGGWVLCLSCLSGSLNSIGEARAYSPSTSVIACPAGGSGYTQTIVTWAGRRRCSPESPLLLHVGSEAEPG